MFLLTLIHGDIFYEFATLYLRCHIRSGLMCEDLGKPDLHMLFSREDLALLLLGY